MNAAYTEQQQHLIAAKVLYKQAAAALELALGGQSAIEQENLLAVHKQELAAIHQKMCTLLAQLPGS